MKKLKILESPKEIYYARTVEFKVEIDGCEISFRHWEDSNGMEFYYLDENNAWVYVTEEYRWVEELVVDAVIWDDIEVGTELTEEDLDF